MGTGKWRWTFVVFDPVANTTQSIDPSNPDLAPVPNLNAWPLTGTPTSIWIENAGGSTVDTFLFGSVAIWQRALTIEEAKSWIEQDGIYAAAARPAALSLTTLGDTLYRGSTGAQRLPGNTTTITKVLTQTGDGTNSAAPVWQTMGGSLSNTLGCLDGYDHRPCVVYDSGTISETAPTESYAAFYTTTAAGQYRICGGMNPTTLGGTSYVVGEYIIAPALGNPNSLDAFPIAESNITTGANSGLLFPCWMRNMASGVNIVAESHTVSGTAGGAWNRFIVIERMK
jgi:hypothetical protein